MLFKREKEVAVCGAFRSGTNFVKFLLEKNFHCRAVFHAYAWKHGFIPVSSPQSSVKIKNFPGLFVTKEPLSHIVSLHKYFFEVGKNISAPKAWDEFVVSPLSIFVEVDHFGPEYRFNSPADYWNALSWNFQSFAEKNEGFDHVRYEDLINDPYEVIGRFADKWGLKRKSQIFEVPTRKMKRLSDRDQNGNEYQSEEHFDESYYLKKDFRVRYTKSQENFVKSRIECQLLEKLGYDPIGEGNNK